ncbi:MAG: aminotransferase [Gammaproteobacteria bacterium]|nr:aminotransferase [Gammaproteobacteria bacterium]MYK28423.1 aminotransferase [Gammaproteobacteria bacterium]MYK83089.1 aminotransferase [Gammaproteobacteria bacterium]
MRRNAGLGVKALEALTATELGQLRQRVERELALQRANKLALDLSRGKPSPEQLDLSTELNEPLASLIAEDGTDARNYGALRGIPEARALGGELMNVTADRVLAAGNSSLFLMYQVAATAMQRGLWGDDRRWSRAEGPRMLTPVPGYDRHFTICESLGIEMINVAMLDHGPDMDQARRLAAEDASIKGIWCVPKYANPTGCIYADETVAAMAELPRAAAADDFVVFWDNAYAVHDFEFPAAPLANLYDLAVEAGTAEHVALFSSTSKMTYASGGLGFCGGSDALLNALEGTLSLMCIGPDKVTQLRHARFLSGRIEEHMARHAAVLKPKFAIVDGVLEEELGGLGIARWTRPKGGYFVSLTTPAGTAAEIVKQAADVGLKLTPAGATFPYGRDPNDDNIRIAPSFAPQNELEAAMRVLAGCVKLIAIAHLQRERRNGG